MKAFNSTCVYFNIAKHTQLIFFIYFYMLLQSEFIQADSCHKFQCPLSKSFSNQLNSQLTFHNHPLNQFVFIILVPTESITLLLVPCIKMYLQLCTFTSLFRILRVRIFRIGQVTFKGFGAKLYQAAAFYASFMETQITRAKKFS